MTAAPPLDLAPRTISRDLADFPMPTGREEEWRFAPMKELADFLDPQSAAGIVSVSAVDPHVSNVDTPALTWWTPTNRIGAVGFAGAGNIVQVKIIDDEQLSDALVVDLRAQGAFAHQHVEVLAGRNARATVVVIADDAADVSGALVADLADGADLTLVTIVDGSSEHRLVSDLPVQLGRDARFTGATIVLGGRLVRLLPSIHYRGSGASAELVGAFLVMGEQFVEQRIFVEHELPHCTSRVVYKGALSGAGAHSVWVGDVLVRRDAVGTDTFELNRNLLLDEGPRADSVPNLELETGDVASAGHASATGRFDDDQLFYLMARGIPEAVARQLVVRGFFAEVVARIPDEHWRSEILARIDTRLGMSMLIGDADV